VAQCALRPADARADDAEDRVLHWQVPDRSGVGHGLIILCVWRIADRRLPGRENATFLGME
jgi:hypothetical protein